MPVDHSGSHWVPGTFQNRTVSRMSSRPYTRARGSSRLSTIPYPTPHVIGARIDDHSNNTWYQHTGEDLYFLDFVFQARMQTAHRLSQRVDRFPSRDRVLERLLVEGTFDRDDVSAGIALGMQFSAAMCQRLLLRVERLEEQVCGGRSLSLCPGF
jgi:hypothetical protein